MRAASSIPKGCTCDGLIDTVIPAGEPWMGTVRRGQIAAHRRSRGQPGRRHAVLQRRTTPPSATARRTPSSAQGSIYLTTGTRAALEPRQRPMLTHRRGHLRAARHARRRLLGGEQHRALCAREAAHAHLPRQLPARAARHEPARLTKRDLPSNINFFMNVPVTPEGGLRFADGISARGPLRGDARARWTCWC